MFDTLKKVHTFNQQPKPEPLNKSDNVSIQPQKTGREEENDTKREAFSSPSCVSDLKECEPIPEEALIQVELGQKDIHADFKKKNLFWTLFGDEPLDNCRRGIIWCKLFRIDAVMGKIDYAALRDLPDQELDQTLKTDEIHHRYGLMSQSNPENQPIMPDPQKMFNILRAYGNLDREVYYEQGYSWIVSMLLYFIESEEEVFCILCKLMRDLNWRYHYIKPYRMPQIVSELHDLIQLHLPVLHA